MTNQDTFCMGNIASTHMHPRGAKATGSTATHSHINPRGTKPTGNTKHTSTHTRTPVEPRLLAAPQAIMMQMSAQ